MSSQGTIFKENYRLKYARKILDFNQARVMGIVNLSPDSFYDGGKRIKTATLLNHVEEMILQGVYILDVGAESTRPGAKPISVQEELRRLVPTLKLILQTFPEVLVSVDTYKAEVADAAAAMGAHIINDVYAGRFDNEMLEVIAKYNIPYIIMHMQGEPSTMQIKPSYKNVTKEIFDFFKKRISVLEKKKINKIIIDPGYGFGKNLKHNYQLLKNLNELSKLNRPILAGVSRKGMIKQVLNVDAKHALNGSTVANTLALLNGAKILRVHDVNEAVEAIKIIEFYKSV